MSSRCVWICALILGNVASLIGARPACAAGTGGGAELQSVAIAAAMSAKDPSVRDHVEALVKAGFFRNEMHDLLQARASAPQAPEATPAAMTDHRATTIAKEFITAKYPRNLCLGIRSWGTVKDKGARRITFQTVETDAQGHQSVQFRYVVVASDGSIADSGWTLHWEDYR